MRPMRLSLLALALLMGACAAGPERSDERFAAIRIGMTNDEVRRALGPPDDTMTFSRTTVAWDYRYQDTWGYFAVFSVTFDAGRAVSRISIRTNDGGDHQ